jgi:hypothetical protein
MVKALNISFVMFVILGTYLLSKQLFIQVTLEKFIKTQLSYKKYEDIPIIFKIIGFLYGIKQSNWFNVGTYGGDNQIERKLIDLSAPFRGFLYIVIAGVIQLFCIIIEH